MLCTTRTLQWRPPVVNSSRLNVGGPLRSRKRRVSVCPCVRVSVCPCVSVSVCPCVEEEEKEEEEEFYFEEPDFGVRLERLEEQKK